MPCLISVAGRIGLAICKDIYSPRVQAGYAADSVDLFVLVAADDDGVALGDALGALCARVGCPGVLVNQSIGAGNSAVVGPDGTVKRFGGGEEIFYADLP